MYYMYGVWEVYYTILYYTPQLYLHLRRYTQLNSTHSLVCLMYTLRYTVEWKEKKMEKRVRVSTYCVFIIFAFLSFFYMSFTTRYDIINLPIYSIRFSFPPHFYNPFPCILTIMLKKNPKKKQTAVSHYIIHEQNHATLRQPLPPSHQPHPAPAFSLHKTFPC